MSRRIVSLLAVVGLTAWGASALAARDRAEIANGRAIFQTGHDLQHRMIRARSHPMMPSCAACHRENGAGGVHLPGGAVSADLRHGALVTGQKHPYTVALLERAVARGIDNEGKPLDPVMPRWSMSSRDLHDVAEYVYTRLH